MDRASRIYIAGHTGLIGSAMVRRLQSAGYTHLSLVTHEQLELTDSVAVSRFFDATAPDYVVLAAGRVGGIVENQKFPADFMEQNLAIQVNVLTAAQRTNVKKLILLASSCMYPRECQQPMAETALLSGHPETTSIAYAISKLAGMQMCLAYNQQYGKTRFLPVIPNSAYGPNDNFDPVSGHVLSALIRRFHDAKVEGRASVTLWGSGTPRREFIHANDIADACIHLLTSDVSGIRFPLNIGVGQDMSIRELAQSVAHVVGYDGAIECDISKPDGAPRKLLDSSRIEKLGWRPRVEFEAGLRSTYEWYLNHVKTP